MSRRDRETRLDVGGVPRVDLLPSDVRGRRRSRTLRRGLAGGVLVAVLVAGAGVVGAGRLADERADQLRGEQQRTAQLLAEQRRYVEVSRVQARLAAAVTARAGVATGRVDWRAYLRAVTATLPSGMRVTSATVDTATAPTPAGSPTTPVPGMTTGPIAATLTFQVSGRSLAAIRSWLLALPALPGFVDATPSAVTTPTSGGLLATVVIHVGPSAAKATFVPASVPAPTSAADPVPAATPAATPSVSPSPTGTPAATRPPARKRSRTATPAPEASTAAPLAAGDGR